MSIAITLHKAAKLQEKIDKLRGQLTGMLDRARSELTSSRTQEIHAALRRGRPKMLKSSVRKTLGRKRLGRPAAMKQVDGRRKTGATLKPLRRSPLAGHKRASSPTGPLAPAVVKVLQSKGKPMNVRDILTDLTSNGYKFNSPEPKKNLAARIYRLSGVKQVAAGMFHLA